MNSVNYKGEVLSLEDWEFDLFISQAIIRNGCWGWSGKKMGFILRPYILFDVGERKLYAHIFSYLWYVGSIDKGLEVCHTCDNVECTNPLHLWLGTHRENVLDSVKKRRWRPWWDLQ